MGLNYMHKKGICHLGVSLKIIMLSFEGSKAEKKSKENNKI